MWYLHYRYLMGGRRGPDVPSVGFKPNPVIVRSDSQSGDGIQEFIKGGDLHSIHLFGNFQTDAKVMIDDPRGHRRCYRRWGGNDKAAESERLAYNQSSLQGNVVLDDETSHRALRRRHRGTLNESTNVGVKTGGSRVGGPDLCVKADGNKK